jgi:AcrR family transcriptional regulator
MPRQPDPELEGRILDAAQKLWKKGGTNALTMRAVAKAAGTNTPGVYRRFRNRQDILRGVVRRVQNDLARILRNCHSVEEVGEVYLDYVLGHPHEYELVFSNLYELGLPRRGRFRLREARPNLWLLQQKLAAQFGGRAKDYLRLALGLAAAAHGTAMYLIHDFAPGYENELRASFADSMNAMLREAGLHSRP